MKYISYIAIFLLNVSCHFDNTTGIVKSHIEDYAFRKNMKVEFHDFKILSKDLKNENFLDTLRIIELDKQFDSLSTEIKKIQHLIKESESSIDGIIHFGSDNPLFKMKYNKHQNLLTEHSKLLHEMKENSKQDSLITDQIMRNVSPKAITRIKTFQKLTYTNPSKQSYNIIDTIYYFLDSDDKIIR